MNNEKDDIEHQSVDAVVQTSRGFSLVWIVPLVALAIGGWLGLKALKDIGPTITITFASAEGMEAGKTKIKYRDVEVGQVVAIGLTKDISKVLVTAKLGKGAEPYLTDQAKIWVVRPRVNGGSISGLGTFLSGVYIGIDGNRTGTPSHTFTGLEVPPVVTLGQPGRHFSLKADALGSLDIGSPVYYRQIQVGQVVSYGFDQAGKMVDIKIFIEAPYHLQVTKNIRFWNASGIAVSLNAQGLKVDTQSMISILSGGIAFELPKNAQPGEEAKESETFQLYHSHDDIQEIQYSIRNYYMLMFDESVRGLSVGAPVELYGIKVGEVVDLKLEFDFNRKKFQVPVMVAIEPERIRVTNGEETQKMMKSDPDALVKALVEQQGLRAQLQSGNLLTGQLMVNMVFVPEGTKESLSYQNGYRVIPTIAGTFQQLQESLSKIITNMEKVPFDQIGGELQQVLKEARTTLKETSGLAGQLNKNTAPQLLKTMTELQKTLVDVQGIIGKDAPLNYNAQKTMEVLAQTLRAIRQLADTLENRPQSLIFGKEPAAHE